MSNSLGQKFSGRAATATNGPRPKNAAFATDATSEDSDLVSRVWWDKAAGGKGAGYNINAILPIQPCPLIGMQAWYDTTRTIRRV
jgi:hypothetical protein